MQSQPLVPAFKVVLLVLGIMVLGAIPVHAVDGKNYPGSLCVPWSGPTPIFGESAIGNPSTTMALRVDCPAVKDATNIQSGWARVIDNHTTAPVSCTLVCVSRSGTTSSACTRTASSSSNSASVQHLSFSSLTCTGCNSLAHYYYSCTIPPTQAGTSWIRTYQVLEND
jgi:hypothetical protein